MMNHMAGQHQPTYMQLIRPKVSQLFDENITFTPGKAVQITEGSDVTLISTGYMTRFAKQAGETLAAQGVSVDLLHCPSVKPMDEEAVIASARKTGCVVTLETQNIIGGLGSAVCEILSEHCPVPVKRLGVPDEFGEVASENYLFEKHKFGPSHVAEACQTLVAAKA